MIPFAAALQCPPLDCIHSSENMLHSSASPEVFKSVWSSELPYSWDSTFVCSINIYQMIHVLHIAQEARVTLPTEIMFWIPLSSTLMISNFGDIFFNRQVVLCSKCISSALSMLVDSVICIGRQPMKTICPGWTGRVC